MGLGREEPVLASDMYLHAVHVHVLRGLLGEEALAQLSFHDAPIFRLLLKIAVF